MELEDGRQQVTGSQDVVFEIGDLFICGYVCDLHQGRVELPLRQIKKMAFLLKDTPS